MKKFILSALFIAGFAGYALYSGSHSGTLQPMAVGSDSIITAQSGVSSSASGSSAPPKRSSSSAKTSSSASKTSTKSSGQYRDGTYTGSVVDAYYGNIQVQAVISGGKLTDVIFLQYPNDRSTSQYINQQAMPMLKAEAIQAQSAQVDGISGASDSSSAFVQSLSAALSKAA